MKKMLLLTILGLSSLISFLFGKADANTYYAETGIVVELDYDTDEVVWENFNGYQYAFYGIEDWCVGDGVRAVMRTNKTPQIFDDEIVDVKYTAWDMVRW